MRRLRQCVFDLGTEMRGASEMFLLAAVFCVVGSFGLGVVLCVVGWFGLGVVFGWAELFGVVALLSWGLVGVFLVVGLCALIGRFELLHSWTRRRHPDAGLIVAGGGTPCLGSAWAGECVSWH